MTSESSFLAGRGIPDMLLQLVLCELVKHQSELCFRVLLIYIFLCLCHSRTQLVRFTHCPGTPMHTLASDRQRVGRQFKREPHDASHHGPCLGFLWILSLISGVQLISLVPLIPLVLLGLLLVDLGFFGLVDPIVWVRSDLVWLFWTPPKFLRFSGCRRKSIKIGKVQQWSSVRQTRCEGANLAPWTCSLPLAP